MPSAGEGVERRTSVRGRQECDPLRPLWNIARWFLSGGREGAPWTRPLLVEVGTHPSMRQE